MATPSRCSSRPAQVKQIKSPPDSIRYRKGQRRENLDRPVVPLTATELNRATSCLSSDSKSPEDAERCPPDGRPEDNAGVEKSKCTVLARVERGREDAAPTARREKKESLPRTAAAAIAAERCGEHVQEQNNGGDNLSERVPSHSEEGVNSAVENALRNQPDAGRFRPWLKDQINPSVSSIPASVDGSGGSPALLRLQSQAKFSSAAAAIEAAAAAVAAIPKVRSGSGRPICDAWVVPL